jgi:hypothetical protein
MEGALVDDVIVLIMRELDPLSLVLFGMTSKANQERRQRKGSGRVWSALPGAVFMSITCGLLSAYQSRDKKVYMGVLLECYATPKVYAWGGRHWPGRRSHTDRLALEAHNFPLVPFLLKERGFAETPFKELLMKENPDFAILEFVVDTRRVPVRTRDYHFAFNNPALLRWLREHDPLHGTDVKAPGPHFLMFQFSDEAPLLQERCYMAYPAVPAFGRGPGLISTYIS